MLDPTERTAEVLFGLIMVLTFTGSLSVAQAGRDDVRAMLVGALGCNIAWGIIDALLYLMACLGEKGNDLRIFRDIRGAGSPDQGRQLVADALPSVVASVIEPAELERVRERLLALPQPPERAPLTATDWKGAAGVFLLVFISTLPVVAPFLLVANAATALRISNAIAITMLFAAGVVYGRQAGRSPAIVGVAMVLVGSALVAMTIALGG